MGQLQAMSLVVLLLACDVGSVGTPGGSIGQDSAGYGVPEASSDDRPEDTALSLDTAGEGRCVHVAGALTCAHETWSARIDGVERRVHHQVPVGEAPPGGFPAVVLFQGTGLPAERFWSARLDAENGLWHQVRTTQALLDAGFAVITPDARGRGLLHWDTNHEPWSTSWEQAPDHRLMLALADAIAAGTFGPIDRDHLAAGGFSSGGYMTSRMAVSYPGTFRALFIASASYATCGGPLCSIPDELPADHPPTLFLHGQRDEIVPVHTALAYHDALLAQGTPVQVVVSPLAGHEWLERAPVAVVGWLTERP